MLVAKRQSVKTMNRFAHLTIYSFTLKWMPSMVLFLFVRSFDGLFVVACVFLACLIFTVSFKFFFYFHFFFLLFFFVHVKNFWSVKHFTAYWHEWMKPKMLLNVEWRNYRSSFTVFDKSFARFSFHFSLSLLPWLATVALAFLNATGKSTLTKILLKQWIAGFSTFRRLSESIFFHRSLAHSNSSINRK